MVTTRRYHRHARCFGLITTIEYLGNPENGGGQNDTQEARQESIKLKYSQCWLIKTRATEKSLKQLLARSTMSLQPLILVR